MSQNILFNGVTYTVPDVGDESWGEPLTDFFVAIPQGALQKTGGTFTLTSDVNFGATFGLLSRYFSTRSLLPSTAGLVRLNVSDTIGWRNTANDGNLLLSVNASDQLVFDGDAIIPGGITALTGDVTATGPGSAAATIANDAVTTVKILDNNVTLAKMAQIATASFLARTTASTGNVEVLTGTQSTALLVNFVGDSGSGGTKGLVPAPASGDAAALKFLKADGTWAAPAGSGTVTSVAMTVPTALFATSPVTGSPVTTTGTLAPTLATQSANTAFAGPASGGAATPTFRQLSITDITKVYFSANTCTTAANSSTPLIYTVEDSDPAGAYNNTTGIFTVPAGKGGLYFIGGSVYVGATAITIFVYKNGSTIAQGTPVATATYGTAVTHVLTLAAGDTIDLRPDGSATANGGALLNRFYGFQIS